MDSVAYLKRQGWRGHGHSLDNSGKGIKKPLLVSKKVDVLGLGLNKHAAVSDQWWLRAFDQGLKTLGTGNESLLTNVQKYGVNRGGLYGRFVKGESVPGTIGRSLPSSLGSESAKASRPTDGERAYERSACINVLPKDRLGQEIGESNQVTYDGHPGHFHGPQDEPTNMKEMLNRKRKRAERPKENQVRRKFKKAARDEHKDGRDAEFERKHTKRLNRHVKKVVREAISQGLIPPDVGGIRHGTTRETRATVVALKDILSKLTTEAQMNIQAGHQSCGSLDVTLQEAERKRLKRELKRVVRAYLLDERFSQELLNSEKRAKGDDAGAATGMESSDTSELQEQKSVRKIVVHNSKKRLPSEKLAEYTKRAKKKGVDIETYAKRREEKYAAKQAEKL